MNTPQTIIAQMIDEMVDRADQSDDLGSLAARAGYDPTHFQKLFKTHVGLSPKQFQSYLRLRHAREVLSGGATWEAAAAQANLSSTGRLYDLFTVHEGVRPSAVQQRGQGLTIHYGWHATGLGEVLVAATDRGICWMGFRLKDSRDVPFARLRAYWPAATLVDDPGKTAPFARAIEQRWVAGKPLGAPLPLDIQGSNFQLQVWRALLRIPFGGLVSYGDVARAIGQPRAARAVGTAVGDNPITLLIPCHRVIQSSGIIENYGWGTPRKCALIGIEQEHLT